MDSPVALLTGCASGIGLHLAERLGREGYRLVVTDIDEQGLRNAFQESKEFMVRVLDVRRAESWQKLLEDVKSQWGQLDLLCNVAGYLKPGYLHQCETDEIHKHMEINAVGAMLGTRLAAEWMVAQGYGQIINIASLAE